MSELDSENVLSAADAPDIDYSDWDAVHEPRSYEDRRAMGRKVKDLTPGDEVLINDRSRWLEVVSSEETSRLEMRYQETVFLKGNGTEYRIKVSEDRGFPRLDRGQFTDEEYVAYLTVETAEQEENEVVA